MYSELCPQLHPVTPARRPLNLGSIAAPLVLVICANAGPGHYIPSLPLYGDTNFFPAACHTVRIRLSLASSL